MFKHFIDLLIHQFKLLTSSVHWMTAEEHEGTNEFFHRGNYDHGEHDDSN